jgi:hypothetical protein
MATAKKSRITSGLRGHSWPGIQLYGWDSRNEIWHGPTELGGCSVPDKRVIHALRSAAGNGSNSWYGPVNCCTSGEPMARFFVLVHDLSDAAIAMIYCNESKAGPAEILAVIPANRRAQLRDEFAFEFLAFARFLGTISAGAELQVHDAIASTVGEQNDSTDLVLSISSVIWPGDLDHALSRCVEKIAVSLCQWLDEFSACGSRATEDSPSAA